MPLADVAVSCLVLAHWGDPDAVLENGFADGQWGKECAHVVIIKGWLSGRKCWLELSGQSQWLDVSF